jgi:hypothetical protein
LGCTVRRYIILEVRVETTRFRSGWVTFAGVVAAIVAIWNILSGIAAISKDDQTETLNEVLFGVNITAWGWFWVIIGVLQLVTAYLIFARHPMGQILGVLWAAISASLAVFMIFVAPIWALVVLAIDLTIIWALLSASDEFDMG